MKGFEAGVKYYNDKNGKSVKLLGWDSAKGEGLSSTTLIPPMMAARLPNRFSRKAPTSSCLLLVLWASALPLTAKKPASA